MARRLRLEPLAPNLARSVSPRRRCSEPEAELPRCALTDRRLNRFRVAQTESTRSPPLEEAARSSELATDGSCADGRRADVQQNQPAIPAPEATAAPAAATSRRRRPRASLCGHASHVVANAPAATAAHIGKCALMAARTGVSPSAHSSEAASSAARRLSSNTLVMSSGEAKASACSASLAAAPWRSDATMRSSDSKSESSTTPLAPPISRVAPALSFFRYCSTEQSLTCMYAAATPRASGSAPSLSTSRSDAAASDAAPDARSRKATASPALKQSTRRTSAARPPRPCSRSTCDVYTMAPPATPPRGTCASKERSCALSKTSIQRRRQRNRNALSASSISSALEPSPPRPASRAKRCRSDTMDC
mmetsp:Transcript_15543/g.64488  ORF Transcript_15543/g.64488 Transcript_15543/m.64488 type:complete len:365 (+) Transcript_15543:1441-2535(+)